MKHVTLKRPQQHPKQPITQLSDLNIRTIYFVVFFYVGQIHTRASKVRRMFVSFWLHPHIGDSPPYGLAVFEIVCIGRQRFVAMLCFGDFMFLSLARF